jgi:hypothetical protein
MQTTPLEEQEASRWHEATAEEEEDEEGGGGEDDGKAREAKVALEEVLYWPMPVWFSNPAESIEEDRLRRLEMEAAGWGRTRLGEN